MGKAAVGALEVVAQLAPPGALAEGQGEVLLDGEAGEHPSPFDHVGHAEAGDLVGGELGDVLPREDDLSRGRRHEPGHGAGDGRLAGPVRADQGDHASARDPERHVEERAVGAVAGTDVAHRQDVGPAVRRGHPEVRAGRHCVPDLPEVGGPHGRIGHDLVEGALRQHRPQVHDDGAVDHVGHHGQVVLDQEHGRAALALHGAQDRGHLGRLVQVEPRGRLVGQQDLRLGGQGPGQLHQAAVARARAR